VYIINLHIYKYIRQYIHVYIYLYVYNYAYKECFWIFVTMLVGRKNKLNQKVLYHFVIFAIINEILITKDCRISTAYRRMQTHGEMRPPSYYSH